MKPLICGLVLSVVVATAIGQGPLKVPAKGAGGETLVTLHLKDAYPDDAIIKIHDQTQVDFNAVPEDLWDKIDKKVTVDAEGKPLLAVLWEICAQSNVAFRTSPFERSIELIPASGNLAGRPICAAGPLLFVPETMVRSQSITYSAERRRQDGCTIQLAIYQEPGLNVIALGSGLDISEAVDENGHSLLPTGPKRAGAAPVLTRGSAYSQASVQLALGENAGRTVKSLKGTYTVVLPTQTRQTQFDDVMSGKELTETLGDFAITIKAQPGDARTMGLRITAAPAKDVMIKGGDPRWNLLTNALSNAHFVDAKGHSTRSWGIGITSNAATYQADITFPPAGAAGGNGRKLVVDLPIASKELSLPFAFKDLPLP